MRLRWETGTKTDRTMPILISAAQTLTTFFSAVLTKKYTNPSSDIIAVLAGLDHVDTVFTDFVGALDSIIRNGNTRTSSPSWKATWLLMQWSYSRDSATGC